MSRCSGCGKTITPNVLYPWAVLCAACIRPMMVSIAGQEGGPNRHTVEHAALYGWTTGGWPAAGWVSCGGYWISPDVAADATEAWRVGALYLNPQGWASAASHAQVGTYSNTLPSAIRQVAPDAENATPEIQSACAWCKSNEIRADHHDPCAVLWNIWETRAQADGTPLDKITDHDRAAVERFARANGLVK